MESPLSRGFMDQLVLHPELLAPVTASLVHLETHFWIRKTEEFIQQKHSQEPDSVCKAHAFLKLQVWPTERKKKQLLQQGQCEQEAQISKDIWLCKLTLHAQTES